MARRPYDPLDFVPSPEIVRQRLTEALSLAERLRILLELAERLRLRVTTADEMTAKDADREAKGGPDA
jgi:hypothetical protein